MCGMDRGCEGRVKRLLSVMLGWLVWVMWRQAVESMGPKGAKKGYHCRCPGGGWRITNNVVGDRTDKVLERAGECVNVGPRMGVNGGKKLVKRVGEDMLQRVWGRGAWGWGL